MTEKRERRLGEERRGEVKTKYERGKMKYIKTIRQRQKGGGKDKRKESVSGNGSKI